jgi:exopolysaccharide production protein ExoQ
MSITTNEITAPFPQYGLERYSRILRLLEHIVLAGIIFFSSGPFSASLTERSLPLNAWSTELMFSGFLFFSILSIVRGNHRRIASRLFRHNLPIVMLVILALLSTLWSGVPEYTLKNSLFFLVGVMGTAAIADRYTLRELLYFITGIFTLIIVISLLLSVPFPDSFQHNRRQLAGAFRAIYQHKNGAAKTFAVAAFCNIYFLTELILQKANKRLIFLMATCFLAVLVGLIRANSETGLIAFGLACISSVVIFMLSKTRLRYVWGTLVVLWGGLVVLVLSLSIVKLDPETLKQNETFETRIEIWNAATDYMAKDDWLVGYGYQAFFTSKSPARTFVWSRINYGPPHAHSGFMEVYLSLGLLGVIVLVIHLVMVGWRSVHLVDHERLGYLVYFPIGVLALLLAYNITEVDFFTMQSLFWFLYLYCAFQVIPKPEPISPLIDSQ